MPKMEKSLAILLKLNSGMHKVPSAKEFRLSSWIKLVSVSDFPYSLQAVLHIFLQFHLQDACSL